MFCLHYLVLAFCVQNTISFYSSSHLDYVNTDCERQEEILTCGHYLPSHIQKDITTVVISDYMATSLTEDKHVFTNECWGSVRKLDISFNSNLEDISIFEYDFK